MMFASNHLGEPLCHCAAHRECRLLLKCTCYYLISILTDFLCRDWQKEAGMQDKYANREKQKETNADMQKGEKKKKENVGGIHANKAS